MKKSVIFAGIILTALILFYLLSLNTFSLFNMTGFSVVNIDDCETLDTADTIYILNQNVSSSGTCFSIAAHNVTLDCDGFTINYSSSSEGYGIDDSEGYDNLTITDCVIRQTSNMDNSPTIYASGLTGGLITDNTIVHASTSSPSFSYGAAIFLDSDSNYNTVSYNIIEADPGPGIYLDSGSNNVLSFNNIHNNRYTNLNSLGNDVGISLFSSDNNVIKNNTITGGSGSATKIWQFQLFLNSSSNNTLTGNKFYSIGVLVGGSAQSHFNNSIDSTNVVSNKIIVYNFSISDIEFRDMEIGENYGELICAWCSNVTYDNVTFNRTYFFGLHNSTISNSQAVDYMANAYGFFLAFSFNNLITNNTVNTYINSFAFYSSYDNLITNNLAAPKTHGGFFVIESSNNTFVNNTGVNGHMGEFWLIRTNNNLFENNAANYTYSHDHEDYGWGFLLQSSSNNMFVDNLAYNNIDNGFDLQGGSSNNTFVNNAAEYNGGSAFYTYGSSNNTFVNNTMSNNGKGITLQSESLNNLVTGNQITASGSDEGGLMLYSANYSIISNNNVATSGSGNSYAVWLLDSSFSGYSFGNVFVNNSFSASYPGVSDIYLNSREIANFTNCTFNKSDTGFYSSSTRGRINVFWYADVYVNNSGGNEIESANITATTTSGTLSNWSLTNSSGYISRLILREYWQNTTSSYFDTNYTFNASKAGYSDSWSFVNLTTNYLLPSNYIRITLIGSNALITSFGTNPIDNYNSTSSSITFDFKCFYNSSMDTIQLWTNTTGTWHVNYSNSSYQNDTWLNITVSGIPSGNNYRWAVYCNGTDGNFNWAGNRTFNVDTIAPNTTLISPENAYNYSIQSITFNCSGIDNLNLANITLYGNWTGSWTANQTNSSPRNNTGAIFSKTISNGYYKWNCRACDNSNNCAFASSNKTFNVSNIDSPPVAYQGTNPIDNYDDSDGSVTFDMKCSDNTGISTIQLWTNTTGTWQANYSNSSYQNDTWLNITLNNLANGNYDWMVWCNDTSGLENNTGNRTFIISVPSNPPRRGGGGGGGTTQNITNVTNQTKKNQTHVNATIDFGNIAEGEKKEELAFNQIAYFNYEDKTHTIKIESLSDEQVTLWIQSNPIQVTINKGETSEIDLNADGKNDIGITFNGFINEKASLNIKQILENTCKEGYELVNENCVRIETPMIKISYLWIIVPVAVIIIIVLIIIFSRIKKVGSDV